MLTEDLSDMPVHQQLRATLRKMIADGHDPLDVAEAAMSLGGSLAISLEGQVRAGLKLYAAGSALLEAANNVESPPVPN